MTDKLKRNAPVVLGDAVLTCLGDTIISQRMMMIMKKVDTLFQLYSNIILSNRAADVIQLSLPSINQCSI